MAGDPGRFHHRPVRVTDAEQGPVGDHQVHLHRLQPDPPPRPDNNRNAVSAATAPTPRPAGASSAHWPLTTARARACTAAYAPTTSFNGPSTLRYAIPSGAGRTLTRRDLHRRLHPGHHADAASSSAATRVAARTGLP